MNTDIKDKNKDKPNPNSNSNRNTNGKSDLDCMFLQLQTQINEITQTVTKRNINNKNNDNDIRSVDKDDIGSELFLIKDATVKIKGKNGIQNNYFKDFNIHKRETVLINYDQEPSREVSQSKAKAFNEMSELLRFTMAKTKDEYNDNSNTNNNIGSNSNREYRNTEEILLTTKNNALDHHYNEKYIDLDQIIEEEHISSKKKDKNNNNNKVSDCNKGSGYSNALLNSKQNRRQVSSRLKSDFSNCYSKTNYSNNKGTITESVNLNIHDIVLEDKDKDKDKDKGKSQCNDQRQVKEKGIDNYIKKPVSAQFPNKSNPNISLNLNLNMSSQNGTQLKLKRLKDVKISNNYCKQSCETEVDKIIKSLNVSNALNARKTALPGNHYIGHSHNNNSMNYQHNLSSCSSARNHAISQLAFDIFNSRADPLIEKGNNKITFLTHTSQSPNGLLPICKSITEYTLLYSFEVNPNDERTYNERNRSLLLSTANLNNNNEVDVSNEVVTLRRGLLGNNYFESKIKEAQSFNYNWSANDKLTRLYQDTLHNNLEMLRDEYSYIYSSITLEEQTAMFDVLICKDTQKLNSHSKINIIKRETNKSLISNLYSKRHFITSYNYQSSSSSINNAKSDIGFEYYRKFESDGNSFYRSFMFAYIEHLIIFKRKDDLISLFIDILRLSDINPTIYCSIDLKKLMVLFAILSDLVRSDETAVAYECFVYSYINPETSFIIDSILVIYMKSCLYAFLFQQSHNKDYGNYTDNGNGNTSMARENILKDNIEPCQLVLETIPYLFNVKLKVFYIEGEVNTAQMKVVDYFKVNSNDTSDNNTINSNNSIMICLGHFYSNYNCVYSNDFYETNTIFREVNQSNLIKDQITTSLSLIERRCCICNSNTKVVIFHLHKQEACLNCLMKVIDEVLLQRCIHFANEGYINLEFYCRNIILNNKQLQLSNSDLITISNKSFTSHYATILKLLCFNCLKQPLSQSSQLCSLSCSCQLCMECLLNVLRQATDNKLILNCFEVRSMEKIQCNCKGVNDYSETMKHLTNTLHNEERLQAQERLSQLALRTCIICLKDVLNKQAQDKVKGNSNMNSYHQLKLIPIVIDNLINGIDYTNTVHVICYECFCKQDNQSFEKINTNNTNTTTTTNKEVVTDIPLYKEVKVIHCNICNIPHSIEKRNWKIRKMCCLDQCLIY